MSEETDERALRERVGWGGGCRGVRGVPDTTNKTKWA